MLLTSLYHIGRRRWQGTPFWSPLSPVGEPNFNKTQRSTKQINFYFNLLNLLNHFDKGIGKFLRKDCPPLGRYGFIKIHTTGGASSSTTMIDDVVCLCHVVCAFCVVSSGRPHLLYRQVRENNLKKEYPYKGLDGNKKLPPQRIHTVGIVRKSLSTPPQQSHKNHHHGGAICPSYGVASMDTPNPTRVTSSEGVEWGYGRSDLNLN